MRQIWKLIYNKQVNQRSVSYSSSLNPNTVTQHNVIKVESRSPFKLEISGSLQVTTLFLIPTSCLSF